MFNPLLSMADKDETRMKCCYSLITIEDKHRLKVIGHLFPKSAKPATVERIIVFLVGADIFSTP
ncbi:hypothetical protein [Nodularia spumigena]|jgi:hypothetical protein|uniref:Uncharacterized protein n=2 Tax=Nodularia spumigena TaxID=70799 RepID=A0A2S0Q5S1_NODSP|nr:hypothetical protein [Nodularia spumigena]AHJ28937.1 hypothetical protein NSP_26090 [Nodularia spumigena CCY9414]AVZ29743.1 hypothetical protein BMF81_00580 [Nodularia spumigena UHCC 0039]MEA5614732.1 hypothetical protein [Nodularia spumigena UHCC 0040]